MCKWRNGRHDLSRSSLWSILLVSFVTGPEKQRRQLRSVSFLFHLCLFVHWGVNSLSKLPFVASWLFFFFIPTPLRGYKVSFQPISPTRGRFALIGPPRRRRSGRITFVSFRSFLALIFTNARFWFLPRSGPREILQVWASWVPEGVFGSWREKF